MLVRACEEIVGKYAAILSTPALLYTMKTILVSNNSSYCKCSNGNSLLEPNISSTLIWLMRNHLKVEWPKIILTCIH